MGGWVLASVLLGSSLLATILSIPLTNQDAPAKRALLNSLQPTKGLIAGPVPVHSVQKPFDNAVKASSTNYQPYNVVSFSQENALGLPYVVGRPEPGEYNNIAQELGSVEYDNKDSYRDGELQNRELFLDTTGYNQYESHTSFNLEGPKQLETISTKSFHKEVEPYETEDYYKHHHKEEEEHAEVHYHQHKHLHKHQHKQDHMHKHKEEHKHEHGHQHQVKAKHEHKHEQYHKHQHQSEHKHEHQNKHEHKHKQEHKHEHRHGHHHDHKHKEEHKHEQQHKHKHEEWSDHKHKHLNDHKHDHNHGHKHWNEHKHEHKQQHKHDHKHGHKHEHKHEHHEKNHHYHQKHKW